MRTLLFILVLVLIISTGLLLKSKGYIFSSLDESSLETKLTPTKLAELINKGNNNYIAGVCGDKNFKLYRKSRNNVTNLEEQCIFYYLGSDYYENDEYNLDKCEKTFIEKLTSDNSGKTLRYTISYRNNYEALIDFLSKARVADEQKSGQSPSSRNIYNFKDCIFYDEGYTVNANGYTLRVTSVNPTVTESQIGSIDTIKEMTPVKESPVPKTSEPVENHSMAYVLVNEAHAYLYPTNTYAEICIVRKGTKLKIIKSQNNFYYCDFIDVNSDARTGWIERDDLSFSKVKKPALKVDTVSALD